MFCIAYINERFLTKTLYMQWNTYVFHSKLDIWGTDFLNNYVYIQTTIYISHFKFPIYTSIS